jgi:hypothetical protein
MARRALIVDRVNRDARGVVSGAVITDRVELNFSTRCAVEYVKNEDDGPLVERRLERVLLTVLIA